jgi:undecaprenyl diphosphate synthase
MDSNQQGKNKIDHIAIIMDGNGRWAKSHKLENVKGHEKGAISAKESIEFCLEKEIPYLTLFAFSHENWSRSPEEVESLMQLLRSYLAKELKNLIKNGVNLKVIGEISLLKEDLRKDIENAEKITKKNKKLNLIVALSYGSRQEIIESVKKISSRVKNGDLALKDIDENLFSNFLYTGSIPDPDILIRTSGEQRISNFLLWQIAYSELFFLDVLWPDFNKQHLEDVTSQYYNRERRYGK